MGLFSGSRVYSALFEISGKDDSDPFIKVLLYVRKRNLRKRYFRSWHRLTNMVWVDQPIGSGFSQGTVTARNEQDVAQQFMGFWKNFVNTFALQGYKIYITGKADSSSSSM